MRTNQASTHLKHRKEIEGHLNEISHRLKQLREARKLTVTEVAQMMDIRSLKILEIEDGTHDFEMGLLIDLCRLYNVNIQQVVNFYKDTQTTRFKKNVSI